MTTANNVAYPSPYCPAPQPAPRSRIVRAGMTVKGMVVSLVVMAAMTFGMIWLMSIASR